MGSHQIKKDPSFAAKEEMNRQSLPMEGSGHQSSDQGGSSSTAAILAAIAAAAESMAAATAAAKEAMASAAEAMAKSRASAAAAMVVVEAMGEAISVLPNWRDGIPQGGRQRIVNKIMELLQTHERTYVPSDHLDVLREVATKYEDRAYTTASSVSDYLEVISLKVLTIRARQEQAQPSAPVNPAISNIAAVNQNRSHAGIQYEPVTLSHPNQLNQRRHILANRSVVDCKRNLILIDDSSTKRIKISKPVPEKNAAAQEPTFTCPNCKGTLVSPFATLCGHIFCEDCIKTSINRRKKCPSCEMKLTGKNSIHRVFLPGLLD